MSARREPLSLEWQAEIERRVDDAIAHPKKGIPWETVLEELKQAQAERRKQRGGS